MLRHTLTIRASDMYEARRLSFSIPGVEGGCFLLCAQSHTDNETRLLCQKVVAIPDSAYLVREPDFLSLDSSCYVAAAKQAKGKGLSVIFVHSHPGGYAQFSDQDNREEPKLQEFFAARMPDHVHGALVLTDDNVIGRVWQGGFEPMDLVRVIGDRFLFHFAGDTEVKFPEYFDRQVRAFGPDFQSAISRLHVGVVGVGGTGSAAVEQLTRLGVGHISLFDRDLFEESNVNRVYGSSVTDGGIAKVKIAQRNVNHIGVSTCLDVWSEHITERVPALALRECDLIFGCTDKEAPRAILTQLSLRYLIPIFDIGILVDSADGKIRDVVGRVTTLYPGEACLFCRGRISPEKVAFEMLPEDQQQQRMAEGYAPELATRSPAVIPFTTTVAATAITELIHRMTGFMGASRNSTEILQFFDKSRISTNREQGSQDCLCADQELWGSGDSERYLGMWG